MSTMSTAEKQKIYDTGAPIEACNSAIAELESSFYFSEMVGGVHTYNETTNVFTLSFRQTPAVIDSLYDVKMNGTSVTCICGGPI
jgi:hypothetical protein